MKKILQDLNLIQLEELVQSFGEKKFRAKQLYDGLMKGKRISQINVSAELRQPFLTNTRTSPSK